MQIWGFEVSYLHACPGHPGRQDSVGSNLVWGRNQHPNAHTLPGKVLEHLRHLVIIKHLAHNIDGPLRTPEKAEQRLPAIYRPQDKYSRRTCAPATVRPEDADKAVDYGLVRRSDQDFSILVKGALGQVCSHEPGYAFIHHNELGMSKGI